MIDLERQIRDYYDRVIIPVTTDEFTQVAIGAQIARRRPRVWALATAFVVVLVSVGVAVVLGGEGSSFVDRSPAPPPGTAEHLSTTIGGASLSPGWERVAADEPWVESIVDIEAIPSGGFVVIAEAPWSVYWSSDGVDWLDADPQRQVTAYRPGPADGEITGPQVIAVADDRFVVLDRVNLGVWVGDPRGGAWEHIGFDTADLVTHTDLLAIASNQTQVLVVGAAVGEATLEDETVDPEDEPLPSQSIDEYPVWVVDLIEDTTRRYALPIDEHWGGVENTVADWFGQWVIYLARSVSGEFEGQSREEILLVSADGVSWTRSAAPDDWEMSLTSLTAGPMKLVATVCHFGGDSFWHSKDGLDWVKVDVSNLGHDSAYSDELGFVATYGDILLSEDGQSWRKVAAWNDAISGVRFLAASGNKLLVGDGLRDDEEPRLWLWVSE